MVVAKCVPCLGKTIKGIILEKVPDLEETLAGIPDCPDRAGVVICRVPGGARSRRGGEKRAPTPYNLFVSKCMKAGNIHGREEAAARMKVCGAEWRSGKRELIGRAQKDLHGRIIPDPKKKYGA
ncbi:MAG: hypothetical protein PHO67_07965 [Candidatus Omnitrophica bacterium]|nr:hypothetical protein [Candidatus Omnitrophota bacterium]